MGARLCYYLNQQGSFSRETALKVFRKIGGIGDADCRAAAGFRNPSMIDVREAARSREAAELDSFRITLKAKDCLLLDVCERRALRSWRDGGVKDRDSDRRSRRVGEPNFWLGPQDRT